MNLVPLPNQEDIGVYGYHLVLLAVMRGKKMRNRVATLDVACIASFQVIYNKIWKEFDGMFFLDGTDNKLGVFCFRDITPHCDPIVQNPSIAIEQVLVA